MTPNSGDGVNYTRAEGWEDGASRLRFDVLQEIAQTFGLDYNAVCRCANAYLAGVRGLSAADYIAKVEADPRRAEALQRAREKLAHGVTTPFQPQPENHMDTSNLQPHQQRVVAEKAELDDRLNKLLAFTAGPIFGKLDEAERGRLTEQAQYMQAYSNVLGQRIAAFAP